MDFFKAVVYKDMWILFPWNSEMLLQPILEASEQNSYWILWDGGWNSLQMHDLDISPGTKFQLSFTIVFL